MIEYDPNAPEPEEIDVPELQDFEGTLLDLFHVVMNLILKHGNHATIRFDAGANNIQAFVKGMQ